MVTEKSNSGTSQKPQVLFVGGGPYDNLYDLLGEIDFSSATVAEAVQKISNKQISYDAVVVDARITPTDAKILRTSTNEKDLPLIFYTSFFDEKIRDRALKLKADDYLSGSLRYSIGSRIKLVKQLRKYKIQWLRQEAEYQAKNYERPSMWLFMRRRIPDVMISFVTLIVFSPALLLLALVQEIKAMGEHVFLDASDEQLADRIINRYQFVVLILFSPIFTIIKLPLKLLGRQKHIHQESKNRNNRLEGILVKKTLTGFSYLLRILQGEISLFGVKSLNVGESDINRLNVLQHGH